MPIGFQRTTITCHLCVTPRAKPTASAPSLDKRLAQHSSRQTALKRPRDWVSTGRDFKAVRFSCRHDVCCTPACLVLFVPVHWFCPDVIGIRRKCWWLVCKNPCAWSTPALHLDGCICQRDVSGYRLWHQVEKNVVSQEWLVSCFKINKT